jgi:hypothetical protein
MTTQHTPDAFVEFREQLRGYIRELDQLQPENDSIEWFYIRYLRKLSYKASNVYSAREIEGPLRGLIRFYVSSVEEDSRLGEITHEVLRAHRRSLRRERVT